MKGSAEGDRVSDQVVINNLKNHGPQERGKSSESGGDNIISSKNQAPQGIQSATKVNGL